jgi:hypothetical protein
MQEQRLKQLIAEEISIALSESIGDTIDHSKTGHIDRSLGNCIAEYLKKRMKERRFREAIIARMIDRKDIYTPATRSGLTKDLVTRTANVVVAEIRTDVEEMIEDIIRQVMINWKLW